MNDEMPFLYKAFDDVTATIRALDAKASYLLAIVVFMGGAYYGLIKDICAKDTLLTLYFLPLFLLILSVWFYIFSLFPYDNLSKKLVPEDAEFVENNFFIATQNKIFTSTDIFKENLTDTKKTRKLIIIEILELSHLRDAKIKCIKNATRALQLFIILSFVVLIIALCTHG